MGGGADLVFLGWRCPLAWGVVGMGGETLWMEQLAATQFADSFEIVLVSGDHLIGDGWEIMILIF